MQKLPTLPPKATITGWHVHLIFTTAPKRRAFLQLPKGMTHSKATVRCKTRGVSNLLPGSLKTHGKNTVGIYQADHKSAGELQKGETFFEL